MASIEAHLTPAATLAEQLFEGLIHDILVSVSSGRLMALLTAQIKWLNEECRTVSTAAS